MLNPKDISEYKKLSKEQQQALEKQMQENELNYLSAIAFEKFNVSHSEIENINQRIDAKTKSSKPNQFNTIFISVLCGLLIGVSVFFVVFHKNQNHPSVFQDLREESEPSSLNNNIKANDTLFPALSPKTALVQQEHFNTMAAAPELTTPIETPDIMSSKQPDVSGLNNPEEEEIILQFIPNAPVIFIHNMKVTNYKIYYFKHSQSIDLSVNEGVAAQYENKSNIETERLNRSNNYLAHKIIQKAMKLFSTKNYVNCIEELNLLYSYNVNDANAQFYLGMCYYAIGKCDYAVNYFQKNLDNENNIFHQESEFYEALCLLNNKQTEKAFAQLQKIADSKGFYSERAKELIKKQNP